MTGSAECGAVAPRGTNAGLRHSASKTRVNALMAPSGLRRYGVCEETRLGVAGNEDDRPSADLA